MNTIEQLKEARAKAWDDYIKLSTPADAAYKKYEAARAALKEAVLYEKIRRKVLADLIKTAGK